MEEKRRSQTLKNIKRKLVKRISGSQLIKKCFYKVSRKHVGTIRNRKKNVKMKFVQDVWRPKALLKY